MAGKGWACCVALGDSSSPGKNCSQDSSSLPSSPLQPCPSTLLLPLLSKLMKGEATSWKGMAKTQSEHSKHPCWAPKCCYGCSLCAGNQDVVSNPATSKGGRAIDVLSAETSGIASFLYLLASTRCKNIHDQGKCWNPAHPFIWM